MKRTMQVVAGLVMGIAAAGVHAATKERSGKKADTASYPDRPVRFIAPFAPGGPTDILSRLMSQKLSESLGQTFVVDNRGAVGGIVGAEVGAKAPPDGYTLTLSANSLLTINPHVYKKLPYDPARDFYPITQLTETGNVVVIHPSVPAKTIQEFVALAKASPGKYNHATTGTGNVLGIGHFKVRTGIDMVGVPYKGTGQAVIDLVAGHVQFFFMNPLVAVGNVKGGKLRALGVTSLTRNPALPDVPTVDEQGVSGFKNITWHSVLAPTGTPRAITERLNAELVKIVNSPEVKDRFTEQGLRPVGNRPEDVIKLMKEESAEMAKVVKAINLPPQ